MEPGTGTRQLMRSDSYLAPSHASLRSFTQHLAISDSQPIVLSFEPQFAHFMCGIMFVRHLQDMFEINTSREENVCSSSVRPSAYAHFIYKTS
jgi:hypothetical protein